MFIRRQSIAAFPLDAHALPSLATGNVSGRKAGVLSAYDYSPASRDNAVRRDEATLNAWLADSETLIPGQRMGYAVSNAGDRGDLIACLRSASKP